MRTSPEYVSFCVSGITANENPVPGAGGGGSGGGGGGGGGGEGARLTVALDTRTLIVGHCLSTLLIAVRSATLIDSPHRHLIATQSRT